MPDNLANQLIGRLLPEVWNFPNIKKLIAQCDKFSPPHNALGMLNFLSFDLRFTTDISMFGILYMFRDKTMDDKLIHP